jgi:hypothetical protein
VRIPLLDPALRNAGASANEIDILDRTEALVPLAWLKRNTSQTDSLARLQTLTITAWFDPRDSRRKIRLCPVPDSRHNNTPKIHQLLRKVSPLFDTLLKSLYVRMLDKRNLCGQTR